MNPKELYLQADQNRTAQLLKELVLRESEAPPGNEAAVGEHLFDFFKNLGYCPEKQYCDSRRFNLLVRIPGKGRNRKTFLYSGHMDVVPAGDYAGWASPPYAPEVRNGRLYGRGSCDMKGSIACMMHFCELLAKNKLVPEHDLLLFLDVDEEHHNLGMKEFLKHPAKADFAVIGEPTEMEIALGHRGVMAFSVTFFGKGAHASQPQNGINSILYAGRFFMEAEKLNREISKKTDPLLGAGSVGVTMINGGVKVNTIPERCTVQLDRRLTAGETKAGALHQIESLIGKMRRNDPSVRAEVEITTYCPPGRLPEDNPYLEALCEAVMENTGTKPGYTAFTASCEAGLLTQETGIPAVILGPGSIAQAHRTDEYIELSQLLLGAKIYASFFTRLLF